MKEKKVAQSSLTSLEVYARLVGINERRYPRREEFPQELILPEHMLGDFRANIEQTIYDRHERLQTVVWNRSQQTFQPRPTRTSGYRMTLQHERLNIVFGNKPLLMYHTHPSDNNLYYAADFSPTDIALARGVPRSGYIFGVGSEQGGAFLFQTEKAAKPSRPLWRRFSLSPTMDHLKTIPTMIKMYMTDPKLTPTEVSDHIAHQHADDRLVRKGGKIIFQAGFVGYIWDPPSNSSQTSQPGLLLKRVI